MFNSDLAAELITCRLHILPLLSPMDGLAVSEKVEHILQKLQFFPLFLFLSSKIQHNKVMNVGRFYLLPHRLCKV